MRRRAQDRCSVRNERGSHLAADLQENRQQQSASKKTRLPFYVSYMYYSILGPPLSSKRSPSTAWSHPRLPPRVPRSSPPHASISPLPPPQRYQQYFALPARRSLPPRRVERPVGDRKLREWQRGWWICCRGPFRANTVNEISM